ncbi:MAG: hypothetical protein NTW50_00130 [Candidatus Berkelbacteria bacterium]|nr:hypothetical protein [Candidatus Berkelbacteria bacterium]
MKSTPVQKNKILSLRNPIVIIVIVLLLIWLCPKPYSLSTNIVSIPKSSPGNSISNLIYEQESSGWCIGIIYPEKSKSDVLGFKLETTGLDCIGFRLQKKGQIAL